jgi:hypothetical protein
MPENSLAKCGEKRRPAHEAFPIAAIAAKVLLGSEKIAALFQFSPAKTLG